MSRPDLVSRVLPLFSASFALIYLVVEQNNWPLFTHHPRTGAWGWLWQPSSAGNSPAMHWYGWLATSFLGALAVSIAAIPILRLRALPMWIGWAVPLAVIVAFVYLFRKFFLG